MLPRSFFLVESDDCKVLELPVLLVGVEGAIGFSSFGEPEGTDFKDSPDSRASGGVAEVTEGVGLAFKGLGGIIGFGGGAFSMDLPCLNRCHIPANTSIMMPTINRE